MQALIHLLPPPGPSKRGTGSPGFPPSPTAQGSTVGEADGENCLTDRAPPTKAPEQKRGGAREKGQEWKGRASRWRKGCQPGGVGNAERPMSMVGLGWPEFLSPTSSRKPP